MTFQKGNTYGKGRPNKDPKIAEMCRLHTKECVQGLVEIMRNTKEKTSNRLTAIAALCSYGHGKPKMQLDVHANYDITADFLNALKAVNDQVKGDADYEDSAPPLIDAVPLELPGLAAKRREPKWHPTTADTAAKELEDVAS